MILVPGKTKVQEEGSNLNDAITRSLPIFETELYAQFVDLFKAFIAAWKASKKVKL